MTEPKSHVARGIAIGVGLLLATSVVLVLWPRGENDRSADAYAFMPRKDGPLPKLWPSPDFSFRDQHGAETSHAELRGRPYIADFFFTECTSACPMLTAKLVQIERRLAATNLRFVSFSVDPAHDTPGALEAYARRWNPSETRWTLLSTTDEALRRLAKGFRVGVTATRAPENPILHTALFFLVDGDGVVRGVYDSLDRTALDGLVADAQVLAGPRALPSAPPDERPYVALGCLGCHDQPGIAPPLFDLRGTRHLEDGRTIPVDDAYLRASIVDPGRDRVAGYGVQMPSYRAQLSDAQLDELVADLKRRVGDAGRAAGPSDVKVVVDPVCGMKVRTEADSIHVTVQGKERWFCSEACGEAYRKNPAKYEPDASP